MVACPKPRPAALERQDRRVQRKRIDRAENDRVKARSGGRCEVYEAVRAGLSYGRHRCERRAVHVHHRLGGIGVRGHGQSALAQNKLHVCVRCHQDIHAHVLVPDGEWFRRVK